MLVIRSMYMLSVRYSRQESYGLWAWTVGVRFPVEASDPRLALGPQSLLTS
jgi:hypothetical protein